MNRIYRLTWSYLALSLVAVTPWMAQADTITVSTNNTPLDRQVLEAVSQEAFRRIGHEFELTSLPSERSLRSANSGEIDGEGLRVAGLSTKFPNLIQVPERYVGISFVAFSRDATISLRDWQDLRPYRIAFINGWKLFEAKATEAASIVRLKTPEQMFHMLEMDRIDLALYTLADGRAFVREHGMTNIAPLSPSLKDVDLYLYLHERHAALVPKLSAAIREMKADGTYNRIISGILDH